MSSKRDGKRRAAEQAVEPAAQPSDEDGQELEFEDEYGDEFEDEEFIGEGGEEGKGGEQMEVLASEMLGSDGVHAEVEGRLWRAGDAIGEGEKLDYDSTAYDMLHRMHMEWPCLTFGFVRDSLGEQRTKFPMTTYIVAGTQAEKPSQNQLVCQKLSHLARTLHDEDSESDDDTDDDDEDPVVEQQAVPHPGTVNRLKLMPQSTHLCATWSDLGQAHVFDLSAPLSTLHSPGSGGELPSQPLFTFAGHEDEGYALDFSPVRPGALATGDCTGKMHVWQPTDGGSWTVDPVPYAGHSQSVEDIAWSPVEANVLMSCGCDSTVRVWDVRRKSGSALMVDEGHGHDVNVMSWNKLVNYLVVTGADE